MNTLVIKNEFLNFLIIHVNGIKYQNSDVKS